jgi:hypothetical protein
MQKVIDWLRQKPRHPLRAMRQGLPVWGTKGFKFWTWLSAILLEAKPSGILELGSGRSTITFAEYAKLAGATFLSIETQPFWLEKAKMELTLASLPPNCVRLVPIDQASKWYDASNFLDAVKPMQHIDMMLVDAPNEVDGASIGWRNSKPGIEILREIARTCDLVIIDDVHRKHVFETIDDVLEDPDAFTRYFYEYRVNDATMNALVLCARKQSRFAHAVESSANFLGIPLDSEYRIERCPEP